MATFTVLNGTGINGAGINGAGIQFGTLSEIAASGIAGFPIITPTTGTVFFNDTGLVSLTGTGMSFILGIPPTFGGTLTSLTYSKPAITPIFSVTAFSEPLADIAQLITGGGAPELTVLADLFSEADTIGGSSVNDRLMGFGADFLDGGLGIDTLSYQGSTTGIFMAIDGTLGIFGDADGDVALNFENIVGSEGPDVLLGNAGDNILDGRAGADNMGGRGGNDTYEVDNAGDLVVEFAGNGIDEVRSTVTIAALADEVENLNLLGAAALDGTGNGLDNIVRGNDGANVLSGLAGNDLLKGSQGADTLLGGDGNDELNGPSYGATSDADVLRGGLGDDQYSIDSALDVVDELTGGGIDTVYAHVSHELAAAVEDLALKGSAVDGTGNGLANRIEGNALDDRLAGARGDDRLVGLGGADTLFGGLGRDRFDYDRVEHSTAATFDSIMDFVRGEDRIDLATIDADTGTPGNQAFAFIGGGAFTVAGQVRVTQVGGQTIVEANAGGDLTADLVIRLDDLLALAASDFVL